ncbi:hypothetical protein OHD62_18320 [Mesorhizobium sp. YC-39]|uniref:hypothetical protein n=1 Tax=unclassified Mesorhizobium TaxID=325217 RepID=UPI0021E8AE39|nr:MULTISPECIES: hypothetical protein [unclassified Mesorhizobium]MCV3209800.1 hypothetical protein [Mesorhizobium sp. YC-2]MCV3230330.1 hypothetical protein [Mesorhizobium sp. YC-39]
MNEEQDDAAGYKIETGNPLSEKERLANKWADDAIANQLPTLRTTAQHWQTTISAIIGLFGAATIISSDESVAALKAYWNYGYGLLVLLSLGAAGFALNSAARAGEASTVTIRPDVGERVTEYNQLVSTSAGRLKCSRTLTWISICLLVTATGIRWYAPKNPPPPPTVVSAPAQTHM